MIKLYTDAAFKNGKSAAGILIVKNGQQFQQKFALNEKDNHAAEFAAAAKGFEQIKKIAQEDEAIFFYTDSKIVSGTAFPFGRNDSAVFFDDSESDFG